MRSFISHRKPRRRRKILGRNRSHERQRSGDANSARGTAFDCVRKHLSRHWTGQGGKHGLGILFRKLASRFLAYPLRLRIEQETKGSVTHLVRRIAELLPPSRHWIFRRMAKAWATFKNHPHKKIFYVPPRTEMATSVQPTIAVRSDRLIRIDHAQLDSQSTQQRRELIRSFVCVSGQEVAPWKEESRWLTMKLDAPMGRAKTMKKEAWGVLNRRSGTKSKNE